MRGMLSIHVVLGIALTITVFPCFSVEPSTLNELDSPVRRSMAYVSRSAEDARAWQGEVRARLLSLLKIDDLITQRSHIPLRPKTLRQTNRGTYQVSEVEISATSSRRIRVVVTHPNSVQGLHPAVVCIGGHGSNLYSPYDPQTTAGDVPRLESDGLYKGFGTILTTMDCVTISTTVSQHNVYEEGRLLMGERLWDLMRCVDYLQSLSQVDSQRIGCAGLSLGGEMAMWLGAMDERIATTVSAGFLTTMDQLEQNHCLCWKFDGLRELVDFSDIYALMAPRPLQCQNGLLEPTTQFYVPLARQAMEDIKVIYRDLARPENVVLNVHSEGHVIDVPGLVSFFETHLTSEVQVIKNQGKWIIRGSKNRIQLDPVDLKMIMTTQACTWALRPSEAGDLVVESAGQRASLRLAGAEKKDVSPYDTGSKTGLKITLEDFVHQDHRLDLKLTLFVCLEGKAQDLVCELLAEEGTAAVQSCFWPQAVAEESFDNTVVPFMQGMLLPKDWPQKVWLYDTVSYGRGLYMPWWGHQQANSALLVLLETPVDAGCRFEHPSGGPTRIGPRWIHALGRLGYARQMRFCFMDKGNYVDMAKRYRRHVQETGHFVSLEEKITRNPHVAKLIGSPVVHTSILTHIQPASSYFHKDDPAKNHQWVSFEARARQLRQLSETGIARAYVHLDGWGLRGYDNLHPDVLPPCPEAGGWQGMEQLAETCEELGFVFAIHDQYRDYYLDAASYDPRHTVLDRKGQRPHGSTWYGGDQSILCSRLALGHVKKNYLSLLDHGVKVRGAYLDVFAVVPPDECYNPEHPATRTDCLRARAACLDFIRSQGGVVSSEEPTDWAIPHLDLVHHGPYALVPNPGHGPAMGIPVPLFNLVYHDALLLPWSLGKGAWGIPETDLGYLHGLANAGLPYLSLHPGEEALARVRTMTALHERVGRLEMSDHAFLDLSFRRQRTTFADGTMVTIDLEAGTFDIVPKLAIPHAP